MAPRLASLPPQVSGMMALGAYRPDVYAQMAVLADNMLRTGHPESTLVPSEREMIATYISSLNKCSYCAMVHGAVPAAHICSAKDENSGQAPQIDKVTAEKTVNSVCIEARRSSDRGKRLRSEERCDRHVSVGRLR